MNFPITDILHWDVKSWSKALRFWEKELGTRHFQKGLELGGREGGLSLWLSDYCDTVICSDLENAELTASALHQKHKLSGIQYEDINALNIPYENEFDIIVFKSIVGGIARGDHKEVQQAVFDQIYKALKPGGMLLFAENLASSPIHQTFRKRFNKWGTYWRYVTLNELREFTTRFSSVKIKANGFAGTFGRSEKQKSFLASADNIILNKITPQNWKYIGYGCAIK